MKKTFILTALTIIAFLSVPPLFGFGHGHGFKCPVPGLARMDDREQIHVRYFSSIPLKWQENTVIKKDDKGEERPVSIRFAYQTVEEHTLTMPLKAVKGFDTEGKPIDATKLAEMLAKDAPVILHDSAPDPKQFAAFKKEIPVLFLSVPLSPHAPHYGGPMPMPSRPVEPKPIEPKPVEPKPVEPKKDSEN